MQYRAQFQTDDGRTHAVIDTEPITARRLMQIDLLMKRGLELVEQDMPDLIDLTITPIDWLAAAEIVLSREAALSRQTA